MAGQRSDAWRSKLTSLNSDSLTSDAFDLVAEFAQFLDVDLDWESESFWGCFLRVASGGVAGIAKAARSRAAMPVSMPNTSSLVTFLRARRGLVDTWPKSALPFGFLAILSLRCRVSHHALFAHLTSPWVFLRPKQLAFLKLFRMTSPNCGRCSGNHHCLETAVGVLVAW